MGHFWRGTDLRERLFDKTVAPDLAPRLHVVLHTAVGPLATLMRLFQWFSDMHLPIWRWFLVFSQMHFSIMTPVSIVFTDAFCYHDACFNSSHRCICYHDACFNGTHRCIFLSWRWFVLCLDMHFSIMTPVSMVLTDAFFYHEQRPQTEIIMETRISENNTHRDHHRKTHLWEQQKQRSS